jgi:translation elongation factor P/translation initiation factor 5A
MSANQSASLKLKTISIMDAIRDESGELWVLNVNKSKINRHSDLTRVQLAMEKEKITIEATWIPQNLSELGTRDAIVNSVQFKAAVNQGLIKIIDTSSANDAMRTNKLAQNEALRLQTGRNVVIQHAAANVSAQQDFEVSQGDRPFARGMKQLDNPNLSQNDVIEADDLNPVVLAVMAQAEHSTSDQMYHSIKQIDDTTLSAKDYQHVYDVATQYQLAKLQRWAQRAVDRKLKEAGHSGIDDDGSDYAE